MCVCCVALNLTNELKNNNNNILIDLFFKSQIMCNPSLKWVIYVINCCELVTSFTIRKRKKLEIIRLLNMTVSLLLLKE